MREIKFRAWHDGEMFENVGINPGAVILFEHSQASRMMEPKEIGYIGIDCDGLFLEQFTGLKDKNGREIYEGDIVKADNHNPENCQIEFLEGGFCATWDFFKEYPIDINHFYDSTGCSIEIIGNIHENLELLNS